MMSGAFWMSPDLTTDDLYDKQVAVYRNTEPLKNKARRREYIWVVEDYGTHQVLATATQVPLVGDPLVWLAGPNPAVLGRIPPGQLILNDAYPVRRPGQAGWKLRGCVCTHDGEVWAQ